MRAVADVGWEDPTTAFFKEIDGDQSPSATSTTSAPFPTAAATNNGELLSGCARYVAGEWETAVQ